jgi:hypothetical protein
VLEQRTVEIAQLVFGGEHLIEGKVELVVLQRFEITGAKPRFGKGFCSWSFQYRGKELLGLFRNRSH